MTRSRVSDLLDQWNAIAESAVLPAQAPKRGRRNFVPGIGLLAAAVAVGVIAISTRPANVLPGSSAVGLVPTGSPSPSNSTPSVFATATPSPVPPSAPSDGTCPASQLVLGTPTSQGLLTTLGHAGTSVIQPIRNAGDRCVLQLPNMIDVANTTGEFVAVKVDTGTRTTVEPISLEPGASVSIEFQAMWYLDGFPLNRTPEPCSASINDVTRVRVTLTSGSFEVDLGTTWAKVCADPANVSMSIKPNG
jgi:hypothetical protein